MPGRQIPQLAQEVLCDLAGTLAGLLRLHSAVRSAGSPFVVRS